MTQFFKSKDGTAETDEMAGRIASIVPKFRKAGIPVYVIYCSEKKPENIADVDFYKFEPEEGDILIHKDTTSAFRSGRTKEVLKRDEIKHLLICGFNLSACVGLTVTDALDNKFKVCLLTDITADGNDVDEIIEDALNTLPEEGAKMATSQKVLNDIKMSNS